MIAFREMTAMKWHSLGAIVTAACLCAACGCAASNERRSEPTAVAAGKHDAWGATFSLPPGFSGGENDGGGIELTDGEIAVMIGRHATGDASLASFVQERRRSLSELGAAESLVETTQRIGDRDAAVLSGRGADGVELKLLLVELDSGTALSFMFVSEARQASRLDAAWSTLLGSLVLPK